MRHKVGDNAVMSDLLQRWNSMSEAERVAATEDKVKEMTNDRESREMLPATTPSSLSADIRRTLAAIEKQVCIAKLAKIFFTHRSVRFSYPTCTCAPVSRLPCLQYGVVSRPPTSLIPFALRILLQVSGTVHSTYP